MATMVSGCRTAGTLPGSEPHVGPGGIGPFCYDLGCCMAGYGPVELVLNHLDELLGALELGIAADGECIDIADLLVEALL
ncbi:MAG TPA: hypothetical protein PLN19_05970 [Methanothrix sp.]|nr:hypothetical protein [Methanothrix sp.]HQE87804.1 hypothetical protein [Methanothrix sp.]